MKHWNYDLNEHLSGEVLQHLNKTYNNMLLRIKHKPYYKDVENLFGGFEEFVLWVISGKSGFDWDNKDNLHLCRLGDRGHYSKENCVFRTAKENLQEGNLYVVYWQACSRLSEAQEVVTNLGEFAEALGIKRNTLYKYVGTDKFCKLGKCAETPFKIYRLNIEH